MYSKLVFLCLSVAAVRSAPAATDVVPLEKQQPTVIPIVSQSEELESNGTYKFSYETGNGIKREETSYDKVLPKVEGRSAASDSNEGGESDENNEIHVQTGSYSYTAPDGTLISVRYIADENGFRPVGDHIPQSIVAAAAAAGSSGEKSGRALNVADSANSASVPKAAAAPPPPAPKPEDKKPEAPAPAGPTEASTTEAAEATANASEAGSTNSSSEATDASTAAEATTKAADATTVAASEEAASTASEATTVNASEASPSTTEAGSTNSSSEATDSSTAAEATTKAADATTVAASE